MKIRETHERSHGWIESTNAVLLNKWGSHPAVDETRVTAAMRHGWRYSEKETIGVNEMIAGLQTSSWFTIDGEILEGVMMGADPDVDELPPMPFTRMAFDAHYPAFDSIGPIFTFSGTHDLHADASEIWKEGTGLLGRDEDVKPFTFAVSTIVLFEGEQGRVWDAFVYLQRLDSQEHSGSFLGFHLTPGGHTGDYALFPVLGWTDEAIEFDRVLGHYVWKAAVSMMHLITATNVVNRKLTAGRKQERAWGRQRFRPVEPKIYRVDITDSVQRAGHDPDRRYRFRWMVRGHYRKHEHGKYKHPRDGSPATWVRAYVKGPAGAPWKGRPVHTVVGPKV